MERYSRTVLKNINIRISKHKSFLFRLYALRTQTYPGYRFKVIDLGDKEYKEIELKLSFFRKYEHLSIYFGIVDDRSLPFLTTYSMKTLKTRAWVAEDADGSVWLFWNGREPIKDPIEKEWVNNGSNNISMVNRNELPDGVDPKWEDDRAIEVMTTTTTVISKLEII